MRHLWRHRLPPVALAVSLAGGMAAGGATPPAPTTSSEVLAASPAAPAGGIQLGSSLVRVDVLPLSAAARSS